MDKTGITVVVICLVLMGIWFYQTEKYENHLAQQRAAAQANAAAQQQAPSTPATPGTVATNSYSFLTNAPEKIITLTNTFRTADRLTNAVRYTFTSRGGGI